MRRLVIGSATLVVLAIIGATPAQATFPGQNGKVAFHRNAPDAGIYTMEPDGSGVTRLTSGTDVEPQWSPDGKRMLFIRTNPSVNDIWVMNADGTNQVNLTNGQFPALASAGWSPDGAKIAFGAELPGIPTPVIGIWAMNSDGTGAAPLPDTGGIIGSPVAISWSPDGTTIVYTQVGLSVEKTDATNGGRQTIWTSGTGATRADWSPDGRRLVLDDLGENDQVNVYSIDLEGPDDRFLGIGNQPIWAPDGSKILFRLANASTGDLFVMNPDRTEVTQITNTPYVESQPDWQPLRAPARSDYKNAVQFCKAMQAFWGDQFAAHYGGGRNAYGKCVSSS